MKENFPPHTRLVRRKWVVIFDTPEELQQTLKDIEAECAPYLSNSGEDQLQTREEGAQ